MLCVGTRKEVSVAMTELRVSTWSAYRGIIAALTGALVALVLVVLLYGGFIIVRGWIEGTSEFTRNDDLRIIWRELAFPFLGCGAVGAATGWATRAPHGRHRIARTLVLVVLGSIPIVALLSRLKEPIHRYKSIEHPLYYPSEVLFLALPPITVAAVLTLKRCWR